jgi:hypothetical protein
VLRKDSISLEDQEIRNRDYAATKGYQVVDVRHSAGVKGWDADRDDHAHIIALARAGAIDV